MTKCPWFWFGVAALLAADSAPARAKVRKLSRVVLIGDSLAVGLARPLAAELKTAGAELKVCARVSANAGQFTEPGGFGTLGLSALLSDFTPELVLVSLGTNDTAPGSSVRDKLPARFALMRSRIEAAGAHVLFLGPPSLPWPREPIYQAAAGARLLVAPAVEQAPDHIHPTPAGSAAWAKHIRKELFP
ncbi:MAG: SGNH/GDSL hydrolase family protein [Myxococcales bacterium]|nr:SGNH/GDSL hydrolase family protein [Myxococcales bacterium]